MKMQKTAVFTGCVVASLFSLQASAATASYFMDQSNVLADRENYLKVTLTDSPTTAGALDFTVETLAALNTTAGDNFGIQSFAFNAFPELLVTSNGNGFEIATQTMSLTNLPDAWSISTHRNMSEFGRFDIMLSGTGNSRMDPLTFTLGGVSHDTVDTTFAAHVVAGFDVNGVDSGFFAGGTNALPPSAVPLPAAAWLFATGLIGMVGMARRRAS